MPIYLKKIIKISAAALFIVFTFSLSPLFINPVQADSSMPKLQIPDLNINFSPKACATDNSGKTVCYIGWIGEYVAGVYKYAIGIVGILAAVVLMIGGVIWIMAGGSATAIGEAKAWIGAALTGLIIALTSYLILYQINPDLTVFKPLRVASPEKAPVADTAKICQNKENKITIDNIQYDNIVNNNIIEYNNIRSVKKLPDACTSNNTDEYFYAHDGKKRIIDKMGNINLVQLAAAIAAAESDCQTDRISGKGACGLMQLLPETARAISGNNDIDCQWLIKNPEESVKIAKSYIIKNQNFHNSDLKYIFAGYNSGYGTGPNPDGKLPALAPSNDCQGAKAFECCSNPGGLEETQSYVFKTMLYYRGMATADY